MVKNLYRQYDEQRTAAKASMAALKHRSLQCIGALRPKDLDPEKKAALQLESAKIGFELSGLHAAVIRPTYLDLADRHAGEAHAFYAQAEVKSKFRTELADCCVMLARIKIAQGAPYAAEVELRDALAAVGVGIGAITGDLGTSLQAAVGELAACYIRAGQSDRARQLFDLY